MRLKVKVLTVGYRYVICISVRIKYSLNFYSVFFSQQNPDIGPLYSNDTSFEIESVNCGSYRNVLQCILICPDDFQNGKIITKNRILNAIKQKDFIQSHIIRGKLDNDLIDRHFRFYKMKTRVRTLYLNVDPSDLFSSGHYRTEFSRVVQEFYHNTVQK